MYDKVSEAVYRTWQAGGTPGVLIISPHALAVVRATAPKGIYAIDQDGAEFLPTAYGKLKIYIDKFLPMDSFYILSEADAARLAQAEKQHIAEILGLSIN